MHCAEFVPSMNDHNRITELFWVDFFKITDGESCNNFPVTVPINK